MSNKEDDEDDEDDEGGDCGEGGGGNGGDGGDFFCQKLATPSLPINRFHWNQYKNQIKRTLSSVTKSLSLTRAILDS